MAKVVKGKFQDSKKFGRHRMTGRPVSLDPDKADQGYQPSMFFVASHDAQGHGVKMATVVPSTLKRDTEILLHKAKSLTGWQTESDVLRWCLVYGLRYLEKEIDDPEYQTSRAKSEQWQASAANAYDAAFWREQMMMVTTHIKQHVAHKDYLPAYNLIKSTEKNILDIADEYWRVKFQKEVVEMYKWVEAKAKKQAKKLANEGDVD